jgi:hypothetical protein
LAALACALALVTCSAASLASPAPASDAIYWTSYTTPGAVRLGSLSGLGAQYLFAGENQADGVAIDPVAGKIYWADTGAGVIRVGNLDGSGARDLYTGESGASGVAIDPAAGKLYWANAGPGGIGSVGAIRVGNLDGSGAANLFSGEQYPVGVAIDPAAGKIYWGSYDGFKIRVGSLAGTGATDLFAGELYPTGVAIDPAGGGGGGGGLPPVDTPIAGVRGVARSVTGQVLVRLPSNPGFVPLEGAASLPVGAVVDARKGSLTFASAADASGRVQSATLAAGIFQIKQARATGTAAVPTDFLLVTPPGLARACASSRTRPAKGVVRTLSVTAAKGVVRTVGAKRA